ncbi:MAG: PTS sugar transporter subunit IIA [Colwellia sp.]|nr:PTS sugar transporter subunit IIA [Colwellia sp.]MCW9081735.1 PTS sugar transporter subunit IIA [Colwellia sp.]
MTLQDILTLDCTECAVPANSKKRILETLCQIAANKVGESDSSLLLESLLNREKMGSTGIGNGIAIPHGRLASTNKPVAVLLTTERAIDFDAIDNKPVDIFICLFVPQDSTQAHLETLQSIAKLFSERKTAKQVRKCTNKQTLFNLIQQN